MNTKVRYAILVFLTIGILLALALFISTPLLYSLEKGIFPSRFHENVDALKQQSSNSTTDILPEIQDFIDFTGPVSLNIRIHDVEQARRDLERFGKSQGSMKNLVIRLDMSESEIREIEQNTALQKEILESLLNTSVSLDSLQSMEIQYYSQNNDDMLTTVRLRGDDLRKKVRSLDVRYRNATEKVADIGTKLGLDVTKNKESLMQVEQIVREIERPNPITQLPVDTSLIPGDERVSLFIRPDTGKYREVIEYQGISLTLRGNTTLRTDGKPITLYQDNELVSSIITDSFGYYNVKIPIERTVAGTHTIYARSPTSRSMNRILTVIPVDSVTNLSISMPDHEGNVNCTGSVMANFPVKSASVQIIWDQTHILVTNTNENGLFMRQIQLPPGRHTIIAYFSGEGYPINPSESEPQVVDISFISSVETDYGPLLILISVIGIFILFTAAAAFYIRRMVRRKTSLPDTSRNAEFPQTDSDLRSPVPDHKNQTDDSMRSETETLIAYYTRMLTERGLTAASWSAYQQLAARIARDLRIKQHKALTAREMSRNCKGKPYCGAFTRFISIYERIRYGGQVSVKDQTVFETALHTTDDQMESENH